MESFVNIPMVPRTIWYTFFMNVVVRAFCVGALTLFLTFAGASTATAASKTTTDTSPLTPEEARVLEATVNLYCTVKVGNKKVSSTGTGVFIGDRGVILTNAHVAQFFLLASSTSKLKSDCTVRTGSPAKAQYKAKLLYISSAWAQVHAKEASEKRPKGTGEHDFALLYVTAPVSKKGKLPETFPSLSIDLGALYKEGDLVLAAGYPAGGLKYKDIRGKLMPLATSTSITAVRSFTAGNSDLISLSPSKIASSGVSGGPMVVDGVVVGIAATMNASGKKADASLRGITTAYIDRALKSETGLSIAQMLAGDYALRSALTYTMQYENLVKGIEKGFRTLR